MYWSIFHVLKYIDIALCILIAGYACYEFIWAWAHDEKVSTRLLKKLTGWGFNEKDTRELNNLGFGGLIFGTAILFIAGIILAATWPVSIPILVAVAVAFHIREKIRDRNTEKTDVDS